ncbi:MAG: DUF1223 domain-containing protein [Rhizobiaceae bacterium]
MKTGLVNLKHAVIGAAFVVLSTVTGLAAEQPTAVVELFTSQGCSSCPAADKVLAGYAKSNNILALSFHVDYWNYLGWKDTFSKAEFTERQRRYATSFNRRGIYTPQAVVNGRNHAVGSRQNEIENLMASYQSVGKGLTIPISVKRSSDKIQVVVNAATGDATLWIVYFDKQHSVKILRGENRGKTVIYHNVVREMSMMGMMKEGKLNVTLPLKEMRRMGYDSCAIILQKSTSAGTPGAILGATVVGNLVN